MSEAAAKWAKWKPEIVHYADWEVLLMRLLFAGLLYFRLPGGVVSSLSSPNGLARFVDLTWLSRPEVWEPLRWGFVGMLVLYVSGRFRAVALPYLLFLNVAAMTIANSQGWIGHTDQIISLILLVQTIFHVSAAVGAKFNSSGRSTNDLEIYFTQQMIASAYVVAGLTKLIKTSGLWIAQLPNIVVQLVKTNDQSYYDTLRHPNPGFSEWLTQFLVEHPSAAYILFTPGLLVEIGAIWLLWGRKPAAITGVILLVLHALIHLTMQITFVTNIWIIVIFLVNVPYWTAYFAKRFQRSGTA
ncbi:MAG TPA: hypothetical protein VF585_05830 [Chthoniobacterales bacterium]|jgi:hypothetical protein